MNYCQNLKKIKNVLLVGLGGVGTVYATLINNNPNLDFRVLVDENRLKKYSESPRKLNGKSCIFNYLLKTEEFSPDLIVLATKSNAFKESVSLIKNFVKPTTLIISLSNGILSERLLEKYYNIENIIYSFVICHTIFRKNSNVFHDGVTNIVWGVKSNNISKIKLIEDFFKDCSIHNTFSYNIMNDMWEKFCFNCCVNQISAIKNYNFGQIKNDEDCIELMNNISVEIQSVAECMGIKGLDLKQSTIEKLGEMLPYAKTSMLQDFEEKRVPEIELFSKVVINLAEKYNINVPYNVNLYNELMLKYKKIFMSNESCV